MIVMTDKGTASWRMLPVLAGDNDDDNNDDDNYDNYDDNEHDDDSDDNYPPTMIKRRRELKGCHQC